MQPKNDWPRLKKMIESRVKSIRKLLPFIENDYEVNFDSLGMFFGNEAILSDSVNKLKMKIDSKTEC